MKFLLTSCSRLNQFGMLLLVSLFLLNCCEAHHPFHVSTAEVEFNPKTKRLEVGLKCQTTDLERALRLMSGKKLDLESDPQVDALITRYVSENFYLAVRPKSIKNESGINTSKNSEGETNLPNASVQEFPEPPKDPIKFVGKEFETKWIWVYFELQPPAVRIL